MVLEEWNWSRFMAEKHRDTVVLVVQRRRKYLWHMHEASLGTEPFDRNYYLLSDHADACSIIIYIIPCDKILKKV